MARKRKKKNQRLKKQMKFELLGLLFIFLAIFGSGAGAISDGEIPSGLENIFRLILGIWYFVASLGLLITGVVLLVKRRYPDFTSKKMVGFYIGFIGILLLTHIQTYERLLIITENSSIIKLTWNNFITYINGQGSATLLGGVLFGGILFTFSYYLLSSIGAKIASIFSIIIGFLFMTEYSLGDLFSKLWKKIAYIYKKYKSKWLAYREEKRVLKDAVNQMESSSISKQELIEAPVEDFTEIAYSFDQVAEEQVIVDETTADKITEIEDADEDDPLS